ncbi:mitogen-activated protein kinase kinase kinase 12 [Biomphalaria glabrata]|nr:mitogen-activated protein kinase kinase kinase 12 [Biomphalaria glabrata]
MITRSKLVPPPPTKMRARKSRHRRNNSRGSMKDITSPLKSQSTYEASLDTQTDATYSSKCSSQVSADVENTFDLSPMPSPKQNLETMSEKSSPDIDLSS